MSTLASYDFTGANGAAPPVGIAVRPTAGVYTIQNNRLRIQSEAATTALAWIRETAMPDRSVVDVTCTFVFDSVAESYVTLLIQDNTVENSAGGVFASNGYAVLFQPNNSLITLYRTPANGTATVVVAATAMGFTIAAGVAFKVRMRGQVDAAGNIRVRTWLAGNAEPSTWLMNYTDSAPLTVAGKVSVRHANGPSSATVRNVEIDDLVITDNGTVTADTTAPTVPGNVTAVANGPTSATVTWAASTDAIGVSSYRVRRGGVDVAGATAVTGTSFTDTGLTASTTYSYTVSARDAAGNRSAESTAASVTTTSGAIPTVPNSVGGGALLRTTAGGRGIYKYEIRPDPAITGSQGQAFLYVPSDKPVGTPAKLVIHAHGHSDPASTWLEIGSGGDSQSVMQPLTDQLADAGYIQIVPEQGATVGNSDAMARFTRARDYVHASWPIAGTGMVGFSMGGGATATVLHRRPFHVRGAYLVAPLLAYPSGNAIIDAAYTTDPKPEFEPLAQLGSDYIGVRVRVASSPGDDVVPRASNALAWIDLIGPYAAEVVDVPKTGDHSAQTQWDPPAIVAFLNGAMQGQVDDMWTGTVLARQVNELWTGTVLVRQITDT